MRGVEAGGTLLSGIADNALVT